VSSSYLAVDQGMVMAALGNALGDDVLRRAFATATVARVLRPLLALEVFGDGATGAASARRDRRREGCAHDPDATRANRRHETLLPRHVAGGSPV
jgi:hypothetical protein